MIVDFEEESKITETVAHPSERRSGKLIPLLLATAALGVLGYSGYISFVKPSGEQQQAEREEFKTASNSVNLHLDPDEVPEPVDNRLVIPPPPPVQVQPPLVIVQPPPPFDEEAARRAAEEAARLKREEELRLARLQSNMIVVDQGANSMAGLGGSVDTSSSASAAAATDEDPNRKFVSSVAAQDVETVRATRNERIDALIAQGTLIRGVLETAVQSELPGMVRAVTSTDVYSFDGRRILLPKGTMLVGEYRSGIARGQTRVLIVWTRALRSDGTSVSLGSYGTDNLGRSGVAGFVDKHYLERFGAAAILSIVGGVSSFIASLNSDGTSSAGLSTSSNTQTQAQQTISQTISDMANTALEESIDIPPTIHIDQGTQIMIFVRRDLDFSSLYPDPVKEALNELRLQR
ncbi:type IV secretion system protein VirB10 [Agrobacterium tumefaciens]|uniref:type IV secretion system protein VirB10 n=1 Tax=Agrobacterium tumefaciens TaxID=358 RepID=UPI0021D38952|nr:type IV secretion system protein VirB10 [Agrobacterium tumefaciens]UXS05569.1 TrbI/VirB10 family protein [Agrobacterium tumefaciens]